MRYALGHQLQEALDATMAHHNAGVAVLAAAVEWFERHRPEWGPGTMPSWYLDAKSYLEKDAS